MPVFDFSDASKKEKEPQCTYTVHCSGEVAASLEKPMLILDSSSRGWKHHSCGVFTNQAKRTASEFKGEGGTISADILRVDARFISLLCWLGENHINVRLSGQNRGDGYTVYKIREVASGGGTKFSAGNGSLQFMTDRPLASNAPEMELAEKDLEEIGDDMRLASLQSLPDFMNCAGGTLPDNIRIWVRRSPAVTQSYEVTPEERCHAQRALSIMMNIQWKNHYLESIDPREARRILDEESYGMERAKQRTIEAIVQINRTHALPAYGTPLVGPAGTGKSQIVYTVARTLKSPWTTLGTNSINDPEQLTGSSRIYSGAKPGIIMEAFSMAGESNLVFITNELDKAPAGKSNGNPADVLPTLLDNLGFTDNYTEYMIPTGGVHPIATANDKNQISAPPMSYFAVIDIPDYTPEEKKIISFRYAMPKVSRHIGLHENECVVTEEALDVVIEKYADITRIRDLEQAAEHMAANALYRIEVEHVPAVVLDGNTVRGLLGWGSFLSRRVYRKLIIKTVGCVTDTGAATRGKRFMDKQGEQRGCNMYYTTDYVSSVGGTELAADGERLVGLWLEGQKYFAGTVKEEMTEDWELGIFKHTKDWLDRYFAGKKPVSSELLPAPPGGELRQGMWEILCQIPYGRLTTYDDIAKKMAVRMNRETVSVQAVGGAAGHNPISTIISCHRVVGTTGSLTGYAGGISKEIQLLKHEGTDMEDLFTPKKGTAF